MAINCIDPHKSQDDKRTARSHATNRP